MYGRLHKESIKFHRTVHEIDIIIQKEGEKFPPLFLFFAASAALREAFFFNYLYLYFQNHKQGDADLIFNGRMERWQYARRKNDHLIIVFKKKVCVSNVERDNYISSLSTQNLCKQKNLTGVLPSTLRPQLTTIFIFCLTSNH